MTMASDTRRRLIQSARELLYARSYADVGVQAICERAGVKKGSFYHFFPSKRDLTLAVADDFLLTYKADLLERAFAKDLPPVRRFLRLVDVAYAFQQQMREVTGAVLGCPFGNLAAEMSTQDEVIRLKLAGIFEYMQTPFREALEEAVSAGDVGEIDAAATAEAMVAYLEGVMMLAKTRDDPEVIRHLGPAMADIRILP